MIYALAFYLPAALIAVCWAAILLRWSLGQARGEWRQPLLWPACFFTVAAGFAAVWAMAHRPQLRARSYVDYRYEIGALFVSLMGFAFGLAWSLRPGQRFCWIATIASCWLALLWFVVMTTG